MNPSPNSNHGYLPEEAILQILARLPIKPLFRTKSVSKNWYKLISDKYFIHLYSQLSVQNPSVLIELTRSSVSRCSLVSADNHGGISEFSLDFMKDRVKIRASCNGLLCCISISDAEIYYVCNPITREYKLLPRARENSGGQFFLDWGAPLVGLTCDFTAQKYNVVLAGYHDKFVRGSTFDCFVYDSELNNWKKFVSQQDVKFTLMNRNQVVYVNGSLHWMTETHVSILVLDLNLDTWRKISLPDHVSGGVGSGNRIFLLELDGFLSVIEISEDWMSIWVIKDYEGLEWEMVDRVNLGCIREMADRIFPISQNGECVFLAMHERVLVYYRRNGMFKEVYSVKNGSSFPLWYSAHSFRSGIFFCR